MCTRKVGIRVKKPDEQQHAWKMPKYMKEEWDKGKAVEMFVKCGKCYECKLERGRNWVYKIWLEALEHKEKCFITLTYKDDKKGRQQVEKREMQLFIKKLRKKIEPKKIKYFIAGEYGEKKGRAHYHLIILGYIPKDLKQHRGKGQSKRGNNMYDSKEIKELWGKGRISVQRFHHKEIGYLSLYLNKNNDIEKINYKEIEERKKQINELKVKHKVSIKVKERYTAIKRLKDLNKEELYNYKKEYAEIKTKWKKNPEFNLHSQGMGWESYLKRQYYKYDLIIDNFEYETPKEFLRKVIENEEYQENEELYNHTIYKLLERKEKAEEQWEELMLNEEGEMISEMELNGEIRTHERAKEIKNFNNIKLKKYIDSDF